VLALGGDVELGGSSAFDAHVVGVGCVAVPVGDMPATQGRNDDGLGVRSAGSACVLQVLADRVFDAAGAQGAGSGSGRLGA